MDRPILFSAPMVRAILAGTKTQTRRVAPVDVFDITEHDSGSITWSCVFTRPITKRKVTATYSGGRFTHDQARRIVAAEFCPYGRPGDRLWVRETARCMAEGIHWGTNKCRLDVDYKACGGQSFEFAANSGPRWFPSKSRNADDSPRWQPAIHMPRWASRITLEITGVRVERLQDISEADAAAEGVERYADGIGWKRGPIEGDQNLVDRTAFAKLAYRSLWEQINGPGSWVANPWVWVVEFKRVTP